MKKLSCLFIFILLLWGNSYGAEHKNILLLLGSADPVVLTQRVDVAVQLYRIRPMDAIIVSGGCGAHGSKICEASSMALQLVSKGVPAALIFKEENSKTTVQNYIFSRRLKNNAGEQIIQPGDTVNVVSNHWHAIAVAARLQKYDGVTAKFFIEGAIQPKKEDRLDYAGIFNAYDDNHFFTLKGTWLTPEAVWAKKDSTYYLTQDIVYTTDAANSSYSVSPVEKLFPFLKGISEFNPPVYIDESTTWYILFDGYCRKVSKKNYQVLDEQPIQEWLKLPDTLNWSQINTGYIQGKSLVLIGRDKVLLAEQKGKTFQYVRETLPQHFFVNWPYSWGAGNVSAARLQPGENKVIFYRNMESAICTIDQKTVEKAFPLKLKWIGEIK